jgi:hypothetical protein
MTNTIAITKAVKSLRDVQEKFGLTRTSDPQFFSEWNELLPKLTQAEKVVLDRLRNLYFYYMEDGSITEGTLLA